jgi:monoamine oxidase
MDDRTDIIIIGAGISGLFAAKELSQKGKKVTIIEAMESAGGRIRTVSGNFSRALDAGPEFIHGKLRLTKRLLDETGAVIREQDGKFYRSRDGKIAASYEMMEGYDTVLEKMKTLEKDLTMAEFLQQHFGGEEHSALRENITGLVEGFDAADVNRISVFSVREEWENGSIDESSEADGAYKVLVDHLTYQCISNGCRFEYNTPVTTVHWMKDGVSVTCKEGRAFVASRVLITVSLGILISAEDEPGHIRFIPAVPAKTEAAKKMGFGTVIKVNLEFRSVFWNDIDFKPLATQLPDMSFLTSNAEIPVWWTKALTEPFLVGWLGGSRAEKMKTLSDEEILKKAIAALSYAMNTSETLIMEQLTAASVSNWGTDPYTRGAYSYETPETAEARKILAEPLADAVFFAGEALGDHTGTVEAALESAEKAVKQMLS